MFLHPCSLRHHKSLLILEERYGYNGSPTFLLSTLIPSQVTHPQILTFFFLQWSQFCCVHSKTCWFLHGYLLFLIFAISFFGSIADLVPQVLLLALLHLDPEKIPGVPIQVSNQSGHSSQHYLQIYWFLTLLFNTFSSFFCQT